MANGDTQQHSGRGAVELWPCTRPDDAKGRTDEPSLKRACNKRTKASEGGGQGSRGHPIGISNHHRYKQSERDRGVWSTVYQLGIRK